MKYKVISIKATGDPESEDALNAFLSGHRITQIEKHLIQGGGSAFWTFCIEYLDQSFPKGKQTRKDYKYELPPEQFALFDRLRKLRKDLAQAAGVPVFSIFTNEQLEAMVTRSIQSKSDLKNISGIGDARIERYGDAVMEVLISDETSRIPDRENSGSQ